MQGALDSIMPRYMTNMLSIDANKFAVMLISKPSQVHESNQWNIWPLVDNKLSWDVQCDKLYSSVAGKYRSYVELDNFVGLVHLNWLTKKQSSLLFTVPVLWTYKTRQRLKITTGNCDYANCLYKFNWVSLKERYDYLTSVMLFKAIYGLTPPHLIDLIVRASETHDCNTI